MKNNNSESTNTQSCQTSVMVSADINIPFFRCHNCGNVIGNCGEQIDINLVKRLTENEINNLDLLECYSCYADTQENKSFIVSKDMAIDAGDLSLEGQIWTL